MRLCVVVAFCVSAFSSSANAQSMLKLDPALIADVVVELAQHSRPALNVDNVALDVVQAQQTLSLPADYAWVERDSRAFWYSAGGAAVTSLVTHVLVGVPVLVLGAGMITTAVGLNPVAGLALGLGIGAAYSLGESALSSLAALLIFNNMSEIYDGDYMSALLAHFAGNFVSTAVTALTFGGGAMLFHGMGQLAEFTGSAGLETVEIFSLLGAMPAVVIAGVALIAVPALVCAWALAVSATPKEGFAIDDDWLSPTARVLEPTKKHYAHEPTYSFALPLPSF